jgi:hypothetical protein
LRGVTDIEGLLLLRETYIISWRFGGLMAV